MLVSAYFSDSKQDYINLACSKCLHLPLTRINLLSHSSKAQTGEREKGNNVKMKKEEKEMENEEIPCVVCYWRKRAPTTNSC